MAKNVPDSGKKCSPNSNTTPTTTTTTPATRKHTGTVPKLSTTSTTKTKGTTTTTTTKEISLNEQQVETPQLSPSVGAPTLRIVASMQPQQQQQQQQQQQKLRQQRKNTEVVAPLRRDLKDLNEYLSTVVTTTINSNNQQQQQQHNLFANTNGQHHSSSIHNNTNNSNHFKTSTALNFNDNSSYDFDNSNDNQRFCYPVRPIPRRNQQKQQQPQQLSDNPAAPTTAPTTLSSNLNSNLLNHAATIGVVIPTTPVAATAAAASAATVNTEQAASVINYSQQQQQLLLVHLQKFLDEQKILSQQQQQQDQYQQQISLPEQQIHSKELQQQLQEQQLLTDLLPNTFSDLPQQLAATPYTSGHLNLADNTTFLQHLRLLHQVLNPNLNNTSTNLSAIGKTATGLATSGTLRKEHTRPLQKISKMVHGTQVNNTDGRDFVVNSDSLEDVALSETSDNRAQSIQSLHSIVETPTPDDETAPSYDELHQRLETSNRNILNMQEQQQQLLRLQNAAKLHLNEMELLRNNAGNLSFGQQHSNENGGVPDYESIEQVHTDMAQLVGRMRNLTTFIQNQNELSNLLGDDGPEILAEQEALQQKLASLRSQRDEMRHLVDELQEINRATEKSAEQAAKQRKGKSELQPTQTSTPKSVTTSSAGERLVPIELLNVTAAAHKQNVAARTLALDAPDAADENEDAKSEAIQRKVIEIEAMKNQLKHLKEMMATVSLIESHTEDRPDSGRVLHSLPSLRMDAKRSHSSSYDRERTPTAGNINDEDAFLERKTRMLDEVSLDLRTQAAQLQAEHDRIKALKAEIDRRKEQVAAAQQIGADALKRHSLTPTPTPCRSIQQHETESQIERDQLKHEYNAKKLEFELLCQRLQSEDAVNAATEADDEAEAEEEVNDSDNDTTTSSRKYMTGALTQSTTESVSNTVVDANNGNNSTLHSGKCSLDSTVVSSNAATASTTVAANSTHDGASLEAASMQSGSLRSFIIPPPMPQMRPATWSVGPRPRAVPTAWDPYYFYDDPHAPPPQLCNSNEFLCSLPNSAPCPVEPRTPSASVASAAVLQPISDPILVQFGQTQQMLINSVCQCNQMWWQQQREIESLNSAFNALQERLLDMFGPTIFNELNFNYRAEPTPPLPPMPNFYVTAANRAQSEQPATFLTSAHRSSYATYHQQQQLQQQQQQLHHQQQTLQQQHQFFQQQRQQRGHVVAGGIYGSLNNVAPAAQQPQQQQAAPIPPPPQPQQQQQQQQQPQQPQPTPQYNNEAPLQSPSITAPIFMHHHNNAIHQNNANLRTQNHYANNLQQQQQLNNMANVNGNTLNNQVPPGNRANNYWDNFRSYSRQNLLSTNSTKSNEEQQQNQQLLQQQQQQQQLQQQFATAQRAAITNLNYQPPHQQHLYQQQNGEMNNCINHSNNLNFDNSNKYLRLAQRSRINHLQQQHIQQQQHQQHNIASSIYEPNATTSNTNTTREFQQNVNWPENDVNLFGFIAPAGGELLSTYAPTPPSNLLNNINSPHYQRNKVSTKSQPHLHGIDDYSLLPPLPPPPQQQQQQQQQRQQPHQNLSLLNLRNAAFTSNPQQQHQPHQQRFALPSAAITENQRDFLLRTVDVVGGGTVEEFPFMPPPTNLQNFEHLFDSNNNNSNNYNNSINNNNNNNSNNFNASLADDDDVSDEIKRNLVVNALKNDKFTTKFYESIKEDVYRRLERRLLEKENGGNQRSSSTEHEISSPSQQLLLFNDVSGTASRDPTHKLHWNARKQQQQRSFFSPFNEQLHLELANEQEAHNSNNNNDDDNINGGVTLECSNNNTLECEVNVENEKPEDDAEAERPDNDRANISNEVVAKNACRIEPNCSKQSEVATLNKSSVKKRKNPRKNDVSVEIVPATAAAVVAGACSLDTTQQRQDNAIANKARQSTTKATNASSSSTLTATTSTMETPTSAPNYELINYIIERIRNQTETNTLISDNLLVEVTKMTATIAQNSVAVSSNKYTTTSSISPKKMYAKIRKLAVPRQRNDFLMWYQHYLETILVMDMPQNGVSPRALVVPLVENSSNKSLQQLKQRKNATTEEATGSGTQVNDADLAEADQVGSANTSNCSNTSSFMLQTTTTDAAAGIVLMNNGVSELNEDSNAAQIKQEEFENNENPDDETAAASSNAEMQTSQLVADFPVEKQQQQQQQQQPEQEVLHLAEEEHDFFKRHSLA